MKRAYDIKRDLLRDIVKDNHGYQVKINHRQAGEKYYLYLNIREMVNGKSTQRTKRVGILTGQKEKDRAVYNQARAIREQYEDTAKTSKKLDRVFKVKAEETLLVDFVDGFIEQKSKTSRDVRWFRAVKNHIVKYSQGRLIRLSEVDKQFCQGFVDYINTLNLKSGSQAVNYFKQILYKAIDEEILSDMPYLRKLSIKYHTPKREFLTEEELKQLLATPVSPKDEEIKRAFIVGALTGLRFVDLSALRFADIKDDYLSIVQSKTREPLMIKLHPMVKDILTQQKEKHKGKEKAFDIEYQTWRLAIKRLIKNAKIDKHITGHCARHTFATMCITNGVDLYTTSKLLGHTDIKTTQVYAKLIDKKKDEAIDRLPVF